MRYQPPFPEEVRERAVRLVLDHADEYGFQWAAIRSVADKIGCTAETLRSWVRQAERDDGVRPGPSSDELEGLKRDDDRASVQGRLPRHLEGPSLGR